MELAVILALGFLAVMIVVTVITLIVLHIAIIKSFDMKLHLLSNRLIKILFVETALAILVAFVFLESVMGIVFVGKFIVGLVFGVLFIVGYWKKASGKW